VTDAELIERLKQHDDEAYTEVIARFGDPLYGYVYTITGNHHMTEDIISETYLRMVEKIDQYVYTGAPFRAWLYRIAHNLAINALRRSGQTTNDAGLAELAAPSGGPEETVASQLEAEELHEAIMQLTSDQQQVVLLRFIAGQSPGEVAQTMEKSEVAVRQLQLRALRALSRLLGHNADARPGSVA
jgi:RNA polymerase sigma-70 factor (ECF subfamily)